MAKCPLFMGIKWSTLPLSPAPKNGVPFSPVSFNRRADVIRFSASNFDLVEQTTRVLWRAA
jgi:hypothetical protein